MSTPDMSLKQSLAEAFSELRCSSLQESPCPQCSEDGQLILGLWLDDTHVGRVDGRVALHGSAVVPASCQNIPNVGDIVHVAYKHLDDRSNPPVLRAQASPDYWRVIDVQDDDEGNMCLRIVATNGVR